MKFFVCLIIRISLFLTFVLQTGVIPLLWFSSPFSDIRRASGSFHSTHSGLILCHHTRPDSGLTLCHPTTVQIDH